MIKLIDYESNTTFINMENSILINNGRLDTCFVLPLHKNMLFKIFWMLKHIIKMILFDEFIKLIFSIESLTHEALDEYKKIRLFDLFLIKVN